MKSPEGGDPSQLSMRELMQKVAAESGLTPAILTQEILREQQRIHDLLVNDQGKFRVLGVDTFDHEDWVDAEFDSPEEAIRYVKEKTTEAEANPDVIGFSLNHATNQMEKYSETSSHFYAYTPEGEYINPNPQEEAQNN